ncbi:MAG: 50S ribosomal protein L3 [Tepidisphaera sp.]
MAVTLLGKKIGMTRVYDAKGASTLVTVLEVGPCTVTQVKTKENDGYTAVQIGWGEMKARNSTMPLIGHDAKAGTSPKRHHREFLVDDKSVGEYTLGQVLTVKALEGNMFVDVIGTNKGKGFAGTMKRHHFKGMPATHGTERKHRSPGSIGSLCSNRGFGGGLAKGKKMSGHMGNVRVTCRNLDVVRIDEARNLILVKGTVAGANTGTIQIRPAVRLYTSKQKKVDAAKK